jgi:CheY-like chemotaxis protein
LVADDDLAMRESLREVLEEEGYPVLVADDGAKALGILQNELQRVGLVLLDVVMPVMNGLDLLRRKATDSRISDIPVILMTGYEHPSIQLHAGVVVVLTKGMKTEFLVNTVRQLVPMQS